MTELSSTPIETERMRFSSIRRRIAARMSESVSTSPHVGMGVEMDFDAVDRAREQLGAEWRAAEGHGLSYLPFVSWALCRALEFHPRLNASVQENELVMYRSIHLGIAVDLDHEGLIVPVVPDAGGRSVADLAREIRRLAALARDRALSPDDVAGGTYTISNPGPSGTLFTIPILNQPQVGILSTEGVRRRPVVVDGPSGEELAIHSTGVVVQSFDHRAVDGAYSAAFLDRLRSVVETTDWVAAFDVDPTPHQP